MHGTLCYLLLASLSLILTTSALPFQHQERAIQLRAKYSVVAVDGGSNGDLLQPDPADQEVTPPTTVATTVERTETVTFSASNAPLATTTIVSTRMEGPAKTVEVVVTKDGPESARSTLKAKVQIVNAEQNTKPATITYTTTELLTATGTARRRSSKSSASSIRSSARSTSSIQTSVTSSPLSSTAAQRPSTAASPSFSSAIQVPSPLPSLPTYSMSSSQSPTPSSVAAMSSSVEATSLHPTASIAPLAVPKGQKKHLWHAPPLIPMTASACSDWLLKSYDNGMWHTSYRPWSASSTATAAL